MLTRRHSLLAAMLALSGLAEPLVAAEISAHDFVAGIYRTYAGKNAKGIALGEARTVHRYFEPALAALIVKDQERSRRRNEVGVLDFDLFVDAQDWDITGFEIAASEAGSGRASATVKFTNSGQSSTIVLELVKHEREWRITNITWTPHDKPNNLRALYTQ